MSVELENRTDSVGNGSTTKIVETVPCNDLDASLSTPKIKDSTPGIKRKDDQCSSEQARTPKVLRLEPELHVKRLELAEKKEKLRKLKMVCKYRSINNLSDLEKLIVKWRDASQESLLDLEKMLNVEQKCGLADILNGLGIDPSTVRYNTEQESFY